MKAIAVIPARYESSRFPGKPLAPILGKPMIQWVYERAKAARGIKEVYIATDDYRIYETVKAFGGNPIMTRECSCGTDRVYQASLSIDCDIVMNVQGDEPAIDSREIEQALSCFDDDTVQMATLKQRIHAEEDIRNPNIVKVVCDAHDNAIYFSRNPIPYNRDSINTTGIYYRHIGIYGFRKDFLAVFVHLAPSKLEKMEGLEQLRAIENGFKIKVHETEHLSIGVDVREQIIAVEEFLLKEKKENGKNV